MDTRSLIDKLLQSANPQSGGDRGAAAGNGGDLGGFLKGAGGGALAGAAVALLLGNKKVRKLGGGALKYGSAAALGAVAYTAYRNWQQANRQTAPQQAPQTLDRLPAPQAEQHSEAILAALLGAARADGHIDDRERGLIDEHVAKLTSDPALQRWVDAELRKPVDPADIARHAKTPEMGAEMYLASLLLIDQESFMERAYLEELARCLGIDDALKAELHAARNASDANPVRA